MNVKNIIFDLGGVILNIDYMLTEKAFVELGCLDFRSIYSQAQQIDLFDDFEKGFISEEAFFSKVAELTKLPHSKEEFKKAWNAMLISFPEENLRLLKDLRKKYRLFLLSNTNQTHIDALTKIVERTCPMSEFENCFEKVYYSNHIGLKKPSPLPFLKILLENNLTASETLFIDDSSQHLKGAEKVGIHAVLLEKGKKTGQLLHELNPL